MSETCNQYNVLRVFSQRLNKLANIFIIGALITATVASEKHQGVHALRKVRRYHHASQI